MVPQLQPPQTTLISASADPYEAVQQCADFAQTQGLLSFIVVSPVVRTNTAFWFCGGWTDRRGDSVDWEFTADVGDVYGYSLPPGLDTTTTYVHCGGDPGPC